LACKISDLSQYREFVLQCLIITRYIRLIATPEYTKTLDFSINPGIDEDDSITTTPLVESPSEQPLNDDLLSVIDQTNIHTLIDAVIPNIRDFIHTNPDDEYSTLYQEGSTRISLPKVYFTIFRIYTMSQTWRELYTVFSKSIVLKPFFQFTYKNNVITYQSRAKKVLPCPKQGDNNETPMIVINNDIEWEKTTQLNLSHHSPMVT
jgi:hypothetical protein